MEPWIDVSIQELVAVRPVAEARVFEIYHCNSKLGGERYAASFSLVHEPGQQERYLATRGFKQFGGDVVPLQDVIAPTAPLDLVLRRRRSSRELGAPAPIASVGAILRQSLGCTAVIEDSSTGEIHALRAYPSAGGLFPLDAYVFAQRVEGLPSGIYHYSVISDGLERLASRDVAAVINDGFFDQQFARECAAAIVLVACFDRTAIKYGERAYRLVLLDAGHAAQNLLLSAEQFGLPAVAIAGFNDDSLALDLACDGVSEAVVHTVLLGGPNE